MLDEERVDEGDGNRTEQRTGHLTGRQFFESQGGDVSIAGRLPLLYEQAGLDVVDITPNIKTGSPGSAVWTWLSTYFFGVMDQLAQFPPFSPAQAARLIRHWRTAARKRSSLLIGPALIDVVGRKGQRT